MRYISILIILSLSLSGNLCAQERQDAREDARQHYRQGKELYSQGQYEGATSEFEKAIMALTPAKYGNAIGELTLPRVEFKEQIEKEASRVLMPVAPAVKTSLPQNKLAKEKIKKEEKQVIETAIMPEPVPETKEREYYIDIGDVLDISVWQIPDLSRSEVIVRPDGRISFPLIGDIKAKDLTLTQLDNIITEKLKTYVRTPEVSIMIRSFGEQANKVIILGEITSPGVYKFNGPPTITELVASAGGYSKYAVLNSVIIIRGNVWNKPEAIKVNVANILQTGSVLQNVTLKPNDIVFVPRSFIGKVNTFLEVFQPAFNLYMQTLNADQLKNTIKRKTGI